MFASRSRHRSNKPERNPEQAMVQIMGMPANSVDLTLRRSCSQPFYNLHIFDMMPANSILVLKILECSCFLACTSQPLGPSPTVVPTLCLAAPANPRGPQSICVFVPGWGGFAASSPSQTRAPLPPRSCPPAVSLRSPAGLLSSPATVCPRWLQQRRVYEAAGRERFAGEVHPVGRTPFWAKSRERVPADCGVGRAHSTVGRGEPFRKMDSQVCLLCRGTRFSLEGLTFAPKRGTHSDSRFCVLCGSHPLP